MTSEDNTVYLYDVTSDVVRRFDLLTADGLQAWWYPHISPNGTELWVRNAGSTTFLRYRLP